MVLPRYIAFKESGRAQPPCPYPDYTICLQFLSKQMLSLFHFISGCKQDQTYACGQQVNPPGYTEPEASRHIQRHAQGRSPGNERPPAAFPRAGRHQHRQADPFQNQRVRQPVGGKGVKGQRQQAETVQARLQIVHPPALSPDVLQTPDIDRGGDQGNFQADKLRPCDKGLRPKSQHPQRSGGGKRGPAQGF